MGTKIAVALAVFCFVQGLSADTLLRRGLLPSLSDITSIVAPIQDQVSQLTSSSAAVVDQIKSAVTDSSSVLDTIGSAVNASVLSSLPDLSSLPGLSSLPDLSSLSDPISLVTNAASCFQAQTSTVGTLVDKAKSAIQDAADSGIQKITPLTGSIQTTAQDVTTFVSKTIEDGIACSKLLLTSAACFTSLITSVTTKLAQYGTQILSEASSLESLKLSILTDLGSSVASQVQSAVSQEASIAQDTVQCLTGSSSQETSATATS